MRVLLPPGDAVSTTDKPAVGPAFRFAAGVATHGAIEGYTEGWGVDAVWWKSDYPRDRRQAVHFCSVFPDTPEGRQRLIAELRDNADQLLRHAAQLEREG